jgi:DNA segregation ATPase FtsK/SpoIIIE, S-DNA-T family
VRVSVGAGPFRVYGGSAVLLWAVGVLLEAITLLIVVAVSRPRTTFALAGAAGAVWLVLQHTAVVTVGAILLAEFGQAWALLAPDVFRRRVGLRLLARWRRLWVYRRQWPAAMLVADLARVDERTGRQELPRLRRVRCTGSTDQVQVRALLGQRFGMWEEAGPMLAHIFGATDVRVHRGDARRLTLELERGRRGRSWNREGFDLGPNL